MAAGERVYDVIVVGGGGAGYAAASTAAKLGRTVAMVERDRLGGTCLNAGCVPTKTLARSARVLETVRRAGEFGVVLGGEPRLDFGAVVRRVRGIIREFSGEGPLESLRAQGIDLLRGDARFEDAHTLRVGDDPYRAERVVIATGSEAVIPELPGLDGVPYVTSDGLLERETLPESLLIVGGGVIGCEFGSIYGAFGSRVTIVGSLLPNEDAAAGEELARAFGERGITVLPGARAVGFRREGDRAVATLRHPDGHEEERDAELLLVAVGRRPRHDGLRPEAAGVELYERGGIAVGPDMRTSAAHVWAAGDVTGMHMYTHAGDYMGEVAGWNAADGGPKRAARLGVVPRPVYSSPEVASIGLTEAEAECLGCDLEVARVELGEISRAVIDGETAGWCTLVAERATGRILGATIVGARATELIGEVAVAMAGGVSAWVLGDALHPYPTVSEVVRWTADQVGRRADAGEAADVRHTLYAESLAALSVYRGASSTGQPITDEEVEEAAGWRAGYGEEVDCVAAG